MSNYVEYEATQSVSVGHLPGMPRLAKGERILVSQSVATNTIDAFYCGILVRRGEHDVRSKSMYVMCNNQVEQPSVADPVELPSDAKVEAAPGEQSPPRVRNRSMGDKANRKAKGAQQ